MWYPRRHRRRIAAALVLAWTLEAEAAPNAAAEARAALSAGEMHYNLGEYRQAVERFKEAYRLLPDPQFLFNIGQAYRRLGDHREALAAYKAYLRSEEGRPRPAGDPEGEGSRLARELVSELEAALARESPAPRSLAAPPPPAPSPLSTALRAPPAAPLHRSPRPADTARPFLTRPWLWVAVGGVVAGTAATLFLVRGEGAGGNFCPECDAGTITLSSKR